MHLCNPARGGGGKEKDSEYFEEQTWRNNKFMRKEAVNAKLCDLGEV
jgi:hypothetical protein